jgi:hypothetical protein
MIYGILKEYEALKSLISEFNDIFQESDTTINIPKD